MNQDDQELRERKTDALLSLVSDKCMEVNGSNEARRSFLSFFARIANRWSAPNAVAIYGQRPNIHNPVTIDEAKQLGHTIKPGTKAITILEPLAIDEKLARQNSYLMFRKWAVRRGVTEQDLLQLCKNHVERSLNDELDMRSAKANFGLRQMVFEAHPDWDRESAQRLGDYARQYMDKEGAFDPAEVKRGQDLYQWKARTSVIDLGVDTFGPKIQHEVGEQDLTNRHSAALLRLIESRGVRVDYKQLEGLSPEVKLDRLMKSTVGVLALERGHKINVEAATFCIYSQLGIRRKFDLSTSEGWGRKPGEFMSNLSAIRKIQKEITTGMEREMKVIARLERELAQTEAHAELLRAKLSTMGVQTARPGSVLPAEQQNVSAPAPAPVVKEAQVLHSTVHDLGHEGMYFKIGRSGFVDHNEAAQFLAAARFVDAAGEELSVEIKRRDANGAKELICVMPATQFAREVISTHSEPTPIKALAAVILEEEARVTKKETNLTHEEEKGEAHGLHDPENTNIRV
jgi:hypothetical protein